MQLRWITALCLALGLLGRSEGASALTLPVVLDTAHVEGEVCRTGDPCPGLPAFIVGSWPSLSGSFVYDAESGTVDFTLLLEEEMLFGLVTILPGAIFSAVDVPVSAAPLAGGGIKITQSGPAIGLADPFANGSGVPVLQNTPDVSALGCTIGTSSDRCAFAFGPGGFEAGFPPEILVSIYVTFEMAVVPEPGTALLVLGGLAGLASATPRSSVTRDGPARRTRTRA